MIFRKYFVPMFFVLFLFTIVSVLPKTAFAGDISTAGYMNVSFNILPQTGSVQDVFFKSDGTEFYIVDYYGSLYMYSLSQAWNLSTASYSGVSTTTSNQLTEARGIYFKSDGTKAYVTSDYTNTVYQYSLSTAWDISTLSYDSVNFLVSGKSLSPDDIEFGNSGSQMYIMDFNNQSVYQYTLSTPWNISTASYTSTFDGSTLNTYLINISLSSDGTKLRIAGTANIYQYTLATPWNISTASYDSVSVSYLGQDTVQGMYFKSDNSRFFLSSISNDKVYQWSLNPDTTAPSVTVTSPSNGTVASSTIALTASASDNFAVAGVSFYIDGVMQGSEDTSSPYSINWNSAATTTTSHTLFAVARDTSNNSATSSSITFTTDNIAPTVSYFNPADNATAVGTGATFEIAFNENIATSTGNIVLYKTSNNSVIETIAIGSPKVTASSTTALLITPSTTLASQTDYYFLIDATAIKDIVGNSYAGIATTTTWNFTTADTTNPTATAISPADNATNIAVDANLALTFSESVATSTGNISIYKSLDNSLIESFNVATSPLVTASGTTYTINPTSDLAYQTQYYVKISATAFNDTSGNNYIGITNTTGWSFTTVNTPICATTSNTATYNAYPTCGPATCNAGYTLSGSVCTVNAGNGAIFTGSASMLPGYSVPRMQIDYPDGRVKYLDTPRTSETSSSKIKVLFGNTKILTKIGVPIKESPTTTHTPTQHTFNRNLEIKSRGGDVQKLQEYLNSYGFTLATASFGSPGKETNYFGSLTRDALIKFQEAHSREILKPIGLTKGTGFFGPMTRKFMNK